MILHLLTDEKFTDYAINQFSAPEMMSEFVLVPSNNMMGHVKLIDRCTIIHQNSKEFKELLTRLGQYSGIVIHGMFWGKWQQPVLERVPDNVKVAWYFWGGEIYSRKDLKLSFIAPITKALYLIHLIGKSKSEQFNWQLPIELFQRIDYCLTGEKEEYEFAKAYTHNSMDFIWYTCYSLEETIGNLINERVKGNNILFCNSVAVETNIFDATLRMCSINYRKHMKDRQIIIPFGYGAKWIMNAMKRIGPLCFSDFQPLLNFLPRDEYNKILLNCSTLILPYYSPAGQGNIITGLWLGMRVYISEKSIAYQFFKRIGAIIFSFESDFVKCGCDALSINEMEINRRILKKWFSRESVMASAKNVVETLEWNKNGR